MKRTKDFSWWTLSKDNFASYLKVNALISKLMLQQLNQLNSESMMYPTQNKETKLILLNSMEPARFFKIFYDIWHPMQLQFYRNKSVRKDVLYCR